MRWRTCFLILMAALLIALSSCTQKKTVQEPSGYHFDYESLNEPDPPPPIKDRLVSIGEGKDFARFRDEKISEQLRAGCHNDLDCIPTLSGCYNILLFKDGHIGLHEDPGCYEVEAHEYACFSPGKIEECRCEKLRCESKVCLEKRCSWT